MIPPSSRASYGGGGWYLSMEHQYGVHSKQTAERHKVHSMTVSLLCSDDPRLSIGVWPLTVSRHSAQNAP